VPSGYFARDGKRRAGCRGRGRTRDRRAPPQPLFISNIPPPPPQADVNVRLVSKLRASVKAAVVSADKSAGLNKRKVVEKAVVDGLAAMLDPSSSSSSTPSSGPASSSSRPAEPKRGRPCVAMFVGLQGAGKTTTCCKYAAHYKKKGWSPGLVCADTFRAGAFDQLKQNATKAGIPFYGSYDATDPATIAAAGVAKFREERRDLIIVDTSGRHRQEEALFEEMRQVRGGGEEGGSP